MYEGNTLSTYTHPLAKKIVKLTSNDNEMTFLKQQDTNLISLLSIYILEKAKPLVFKDVIEQLKKFLDTIRCLEDLKQIPNKFNDNYKHVKKVWMEDGFFYMAKGWEEAEHQRMYIALQSSKRRINDLYETISK